MLPVEPSRITAIAIVALHLLSVAAVAAADIPPWIALTAAALILASLVYNQRASRVRQTLIWHKGDSWHIERDAQPVQQYTLSHIDFLSRWLVIITLARDARSGWQRRTKVVITADSLDADTFRLLRVRLKIEAIPRLQAAPERPFPER